MNTDDPQIVALIPARYQSSRFDGKPLALIQGKPMIQHVVERARRAPLLSQVIVATDDERIAEAVDAFGGAWVMTRRNHTTGTDRLAEAADLLDLDDDDVVVNIQGDQPLVPWEIIEQVVQPLLDDPDLSMSTLAFRIIDPAEIPDPNHVKTVFDYRGNALYFSRSPIPFQRDLSGQEQPTYYRHLGIYAYRKAFLTTFVGLPEGQWERFEKLEQLRALEFGYAVRVVITGYDSIEVDTQDDIARVEALLRAGR
ncbi:MAG: 3-deoxy-manno-octulosonate cytidylyltransferase [Desulfobulbus sp.]|jgi:3-deoxy-manno-octulosonate cytidylyltransferase (CMP-KDO synthetase)